MQRRITITRALSVAFLGLLVLAACSPDVDVPATYSVAVEVDGTGSGSVTSSPEGIDVRSGDAPTSATFDQGTEVTLTALADADSTFAGWAGDCSGTEPCVITLDDDANVTATFNEVVEFTLTVTTTGRDGNVTSSPAGIDLDAGFDTLTVADGDTVTLTATPAAGNEFFGWTSGGCTGSDDSCEVTVTADITVNAHFFDPIQDVTTTPIRVAASADDAHEYQQFVNDDYPAGSVHTDSSRIGLGWDGTRGEVVTGLRFLNVGIPQGALVTEATVTFTPLGGTAQNVGTPTFDFRGEASDDAGTFVYDPASPANFDISSRPTTNSVVNWLPGPWDGATATTNDLASVVQELVDREGWGVSSPVVIIISSTNSDQDNRRRAVAWDSNPDAAPLLTVSYYAPATP